MDVSIGEVQAQVETATPQPSTPAQDSDNRVGLTQEAHERRLQQRRSERIHMRLCPR